MSNQFCKVQTTFDGRVAQTVDLTYLYGGKQPNSLMQIGDTHYTYGKAGNPVGIIPHRLR
ncbi:MAG: hypothetical protein EOL97_16720 [Spirochaetia bacterium]|nr:hypothetical protein [Spirochaetia bacterium]